MTICQLKSPIAFSLLYWKGLNCDALSHRLLRLNFCKHTWVSKGLGIIFSLPHFLYINKQQEVFADAVPHDFKIKLPQQSREYTVLWKARLPNCLRSSLVTGRVSSSVGTPGFMPWKKNYSYTYLLLLSTVYVQDCKQITLSQSPTFFYFFSEDPFVFFSQAKIHVLYSYVPPSQRGAAFINEIRIPREITILFCYCGGQDRALLTLCNLI